MIKRHASKEYHIGEHFEYFDSIRELNVYGLIPKYENKFYEILKKGISVEIKRKYPRNYGFFTLRFKNSESTSHAVLLRENQSIANEIARIAPILDMFCEDTQDD